MKDLIKQLESNYDVKLPERYKKFLLTEEYKKYPKIQFSGFIKGPYNLNFTDASILDPVEIAEGAGIDGMEMEDLEWSENCSDYIPIASLSHPDVEEPKMFLMANIKNESVPILLFDGVEFCTIYPISKSLDSFLKNLPKAENGKGGFTPGYEDSDEEE